MNSKKDTPQPELSTGSESSANPRSSDKFISTHLEEFLLEKLKSAGRFEGLNATTSSLVFSILYQKKAGPLLWAVSDNQTAGEIEENLKFFLPPAGQEKILVLPSLEADPYRGLSPHPDLSARRAMGLWKLSKGFDGVLITPVTSLISRLMSPADFLSRCIPELNA